MSAPCNEKHHKSGRIFTAIAVVAAVAAVGTGAHAASAFAAAGGAQSNVVAAATTCKLGHGVQHVVEITLDGVHFNRDNPNVPSDLELMPHLLGYLEQNGVMLTNNHTPLIAHTATDSMTTYTGLYGDRSGMPISNDYLAYNKDGSADPADSMAYWTDPVLDIATPPNAGHDTNPSLVYSSAPPATAPTRVAPTTIAPAPWVPFTRAGCNVGDVASTSMVLGSTSDIPKVFGAKSPEARQLAADKDPYKDPETADFLGIAVHCALREKFCASATAIKFGATARTRTAVADSLPDEPGGYAGFQALFGNRYVAPQIGATKPNVERHGFRVTNSKGNLVDLFGNEIDGAGLTEHPGFPGNVNAAQTLAYVADMQEDGVPVTFGSIGSLHTNEGIPSLAACKGASGDLGSGSSCYLAQAQYYDKAFDAFFKRLKADGLTPKNTLLVIGSDEGDHQAAANVGRKLEPTPAGCDGAKVSGSVVKPAVACTYPAGAFGVLNANINGLLATETSDTTSFSLQGGVAPQFYVDGNPAASSSGVRQLELDVSSLTVSNPYTGNTSEQLTNYLADPEEEAILHLVNADPARTPTFTLFAKPDMRVLTGPHGCKVSCTQQDATSAWESGGYAAEINNDWVSFVGPGVLHLGLDGSGPTKGPSSSGPSSGQETVPQQSAGNNGPWVDLVDIQPTTLYLAGLEDDYVPDGRVITQILAHDPANLRAHDVLVLSSCYKQIDSSVGTFGTATLQAVTAAIESTSSGDETYLLTDSAISSLEHSRDYLVGEIEQELSAAEFHSKPISPSVASTQTAFCAYLVNSAEQLASSTTAATASSVINGTAHTSLAFRATMDGLLRASLAGRLGSARMPQNTVTVSDSVFMQV